MTDADLYGEICWDTFHAAGLLESRYRWGKGHIVILTEDGLVRSPSDLICWWHRSQYATTDRQREVISRGYTKYRKQWKVQLWHDRHRYYGGLYSYELQAIKAIKYLREQLAMGNLSIRTQDVYDYVLTKKKKEKRHGLDQD